MMCQLFIFLDIYGMIFDYLMRDIKYSPVQYIAAKSLAVLFEKKYYGKDRKMYVNLSDFF